MKAEVIQANLQVIDESFEHSSPSRRIVVQTRGISGTLMLADGVMPEARRMRIHSHRNGQTVRVVINPDPIGAVHVWVYLSDKEQQELAENIIKHIDHTSMDNASKDERIALVKDIVFQTLNALPR